MSPSAIAIAVANRVVDAAPTVRAYVRATVARLWWFGAAALIAVGCGVLGDLAFRRHGWSGAVGMQVMFWYALLGLWALIIAAIRRAVREGE